MPGKPSIGAWLSYGLGSDAQNLPAFVVMTPRWSAKRDAQALYQRLWGSGFLPSQHQGVALRSGGDPVLFINNPNGVDADTRRLMLDGLGRLNEQAFERSGDPEIQARIAQYEMAFRMQSSIPELTSIADEPKSVLDLYGPEVTQPGTFGCQRAPGPAPCRKRGGASCRYFIGNGTITVICPAIFRSNAVTSIMTCKGLILDLKQRGLLEDTLVCMGRGVRSYGLLPGGELRRDNYGRDHHPRCFTMWMAGAGVKPGTVYGETDDFSYNIVRDPVHIRDLNATILHLMGIDHKRLSYSFQGLDQRLTGTEESQVVKGVLA